MAEKNDIRDVISQYVNLKKAGSSYVGLCPFHNEKTPSFSVSPQKGIFHCFGCGEGGNVIHFMMKIENMPFVEAVEKLAQRAGVTLPKPDEKDSARHAHLAKERENIYQINLEAAQYFYDNLKEGKTAVDYLKKRSLSGAEAKKFFLGYAKDSWDSLFKYLLQKGYTESDIQKAGLIKASENGKYYDFYRNRVMFPIFDTRNRVIGFGGRTLGDSKSKYLNSPDTPVFNKSRNLYFLNVARRAKKDFVILVEGYMDVISLAKSGYINTVATLGTALTSSQAKIIASEFKEVVICYDSDGAGRNATNKAIKILREHEIAVSVLNLKDKKDPDEYINTYGVARFDNCLSKRKSDMMYLIDTLEEEYDVTQNSDKVAFVGSMMEYLKLIKNPVELDVYVEELSERTRVSANAIYSQLGIVKAVTATESGSRSETPDVNMIARRKTPLSSDAALERTRQLMLSLLISHKSVYKSKRQSINPNLFENETHKKLLNFIMAFYDIDKNIEPLQVIDFFTDENEIKEVSLILSLDNMTDDADKAFDDYLKVITDRMNRKNILNQLNGNNPDKIEKLNKIIKNQ
ncbi:MAG: DNA primase [Clostridia bacterium]|nr:DNA primase [Clostridia bacterium]